MPKQILFGIRYPMGVVSGGKGKGRGKGFGRGRGRGRRSNEWVNAALTVAAYAEDPAHQSAVPTSATPSVAPPATTPLASPPAPPVVAPPAVVESGSSMVDAADELDVEDLYSVDYDTTALSINVVQP